MTGPNVSLVSPLSYRNEDVVALLKRLLEEAESGDVKSLAVVWECNNGEIGHEAAFGQWSHRSAVVGKLQILSTHIVLNECLEWKPL